MKSLGACGSPPLQHVDDLPSLGPRGSPPSKRVDHLPSRSAWIASLAARGITSLEVMDRLPRNLWINTLGPRGSHPSERVDRLPCSAWIAYLEARGSPPSERVDVPWVALMGSLEHRQAVRSCGCTRLRAHASQTSTKRAGASAQAHRARASLFQFFVRVSFVFPKLFSAPNSIPE
jgi:hypothetical protein